MESIYEILMTLPLFQGVSREKLSELIEKTPFHFLKYSDKQEIISAGDVCQHVRFIISGDVRLDIASANRRVHINETLSGPNVIGSDYLFGRNTIYPFSAFACGNCGIMQISKADYINILHSDKVFLFNLLNSLSRNSQKLTSGLLSLSSGTIAERLSFFVTSLTQRGSKDIKVIFKQKDLCAILGAQRSSFINAMNQMKEDGLIDYSLSEITVADRQGLLDIVHSED